MAACADVPDLPPQPLFETPWRPFTHWRYPDDVTFDVDVAQPPRVIRFATSVNVGNVKVIEGDSSSTGNVTPTTTGRWGLRMDASSNDVAAITTQVIAEEGDVFDFIVVFPTFPDAFNPGFAYFANIQNTDQGIGLPLINDTQRFGSAGRLQGFMNMNHPAAYTQMDGRAISDPASAVFPIMGQELTHRWLAFAQVRKDGFMDGQASEALLGRDRAHWAATVHTGPADMSGEVYVSVQDGIAWQDNGNGTFTVIEVFSDPQFVISPRARFSTLDLYLMGLNAPAEVDPFYLITGARYGANYVPPTARLSPGMTVTGIRQDFTIDHVIAALGERIPSSAESQKDFTMAIVVLTQPGQTADDVAALTAQVDSFRQQWEQRFNEWTNGRATVCTALSGNCNVAHLHIEDVVKQDTSGDGSYAPGETINFTVMVRNSGTIMSGAATMALTLPDLTTADRESASINPLGANESAELNFAVTPSPAFPCGEQLRLAFTLSDAGGGSSSRPIDVEIGVRTLVQLSMETNPGWSLNPDGTDAATDGLWAWGVTRQTDLRQYGASQIVFQPGGDGSGAGSHAMLTDPGTDVLQPTDVGNTDVDDGVTTVESGALALDGLIDPVLEWSSWHSAIIIDATNHVWDAAAGDDLVTRLSVNGQTWIEVDRDSSNDFAWKRKRVRLFGVTGLDARQANAVTMRFSIGDQGGEQNVVEGGIDEVRLTDLLPGCTGSSTSSSSGGGSSSSLTGSTSFAASTSSGASTSASESSSSEAHASSGSDVDPPPVNPLCNCESTEGEGPSAFVLVGAALLAVVRRRSAR